MYKLTSEVPRPGSPGGVSRLEAALRAVPREAYVWLGGLLALAAADPTAPPLLDLCLFEAVGLSFCPGCGLGHAVAWLARGDVAASFHAHPLGIPAAAVLLGHVAWLIRGTAPSSSQLCSSSTA